MITLEQMVALKKREQEYTGNPSTRLLLSKKVLSMTVSPTSTGKSTIMDEVLTIVDQSNSAWEVAGTSTTRAGRPNIDPSNYITDIPHETMVKMVESGELVNYSVFPNKDIGDIYGTLPEGFPATYNLLPTMPSSVPILQRAGFERTETSFVVVTVEDWKEWLEQSGRLTPKRMEEAVNNIQYGLENSSTLHFIENSGKSGGLQLAARKIIDITLGNYPSNQDKEHCVELAKNMLDFAKKYTSVA